MQNNVLELLKSIVQATEDGVMEWKGGEEKEIFSNSTRMRECRIKFKEYTIETMIETNSTPNTCFSVRITRGKKDVVNITGGSCCGILVEEQRILPEDIVILCITQIDNLTVFQTDLKIQKMSAEKQKISEDLEERLKIIMKV